jgi:2-amino-4-hydroxy-6-hydroxymethyldihydropteridine diphosphokinase
LIQVYLNLGSNIDREAMLRAGLAELRERFGELAFSSVYQSAAVGFEGDFFWNLGVGLQTELTLPELATQLRELEYAHGRPMDATRFSSRTLDIDILTYAETVGEFDGVVVPRPELTENAHVLAPMAELAPASKHPLLGISYGELWAGYDKISQPLERVELDLS